MRTRKTSDYSPLKPGSKAEQTAINARAEMLATFASIPTKEETNRNRWQTRMEKNAKGFKVKE